MNKIDKISSLGPNILLEREVFSQPVKYIVGQMVVNDVEKNQEEEEDTICGEEVGVLQL